jgi:Amt family ammonium transporter
VPAVLLGAAAERSRTLPALLFIFCWTTLVYDFLAHWIWSSNGWAAKWGVLDYAGGVPVEIASGVGGLAYSYFIGKRRGYGTERVLFKPSNVSSVTLGTVLLWFGWMGFNGGSCYAANLKAAMSIFCTNLAGSVGAITWMIMDFRLEHKWSMVGFCTGAIAGLVAITPAAGFVGAPAAALIGLVSAVVSNLATRLKSTMRVDDPMDIFAVHALAGVVGCLMTGIFAQSSVAANDGFTEIPGGWLNGHWIQLGKQVAWVAVGAGWTFVVTIAIMFVINLIPGCKFRASEEAQIIGMDEADHDEYIADYAFFRRDLEEPDMRMWRTFTPQFNQTPAPYRRSMSQEDVERGRGLSPHPRHDRSRSRTRTGDIEPMEPINEAHGEGQVRFQQEKLEGTPTSSTATSLDKPIDEKDVADRH